jgi:hypothetical protein
MLWETALMSSGFTLSNPATFSACMNRMDAAPLGVHGQLEELPPIVESSTHADDGKTADPGDLHEVC